MNAILTMAWKDIREHARWAALLMLALAGALAFSLSSNIQRGNTGNFGDPFAMVSAVGLPAAAMVLGFLVVVFESRRDPWAFLIHRPAPRAALFWGKLLAAWAMYVIAAGLPMLGALLWLSRPGHVPQPFFWAMELPSVADFLVGMAGAPAGMLVALRPARWYGSRMMPVGACVIAGFISFAAREFWQALQVTAVGSALLVAAARWVFVAGVSPHRSRGWGKAALAITIFPGLALVAGLTVGFAIQAFSRPGPSSHSQAKLLRDGRMVRVVYRYEPGMLGAKESVEDFDGKPITDLEGVLDSNTMSVRSAPAAVLGRHPSLPSLSGSKSPRWYRVESQRFVQLHSYWGLGRYWHYVPSAGRFILYDQRDNRLNGSLGPDGFARAGSPVTARFPGDLISVSGGEEHALAAFSGGVYRVDLKASKVLAVLYEPPAGQAIISVGSISEVPESGGMPVVTTLVVRVDSRILMLTSDGKPIRSFEVPMELESSLWGLTLHRTFKPDRYYLMGMKLDEQSAARWGPLSVMELDPATGRPGEAKTYEQGQWVSSPPPVWVTGLAGFTAAPAGMGTYAAIGAVMMGQRSLWEELRAPRSATVLRGLGVGMGLSSLIGALGCAWTARRSVMGRGRIIGWTVAGALLACWGGC